MSFVVGKMAGKIDSMFNEVEDGIQRLNGELGYIRAVLTDIKMDKTSVDSTKIPWIRDIEDISYEIIYLIDDFEHRSTKLEKFYDVEKQNMQHELYKNCKKVIDEIVSKLDKVKSWKISYNIEIVDKDKNGGMTVSSETRRRTSPSEVPSIEIVGIHDKFKKISATLVEHKNPRRTYLLCGIGGLGKTTFARTLFNYVQDKQFDFTFWVYVSSEYDLADVLRSVIMSYTNNSTKRASQLASMKQPELEHVIANDLTKGRYFGVFDDIWDRSLWPVLNRIFPHTKNGSILVLTSRDQRVTGLDRHVDVHELSLLDSETSSELFRSRFCRISDLGEEFTHLWTKLVDACEGLPLAIATLGDILSSKKYLQEWYAIESELLNSLKAHNDFIPEIFSLSYAALPVQLKPCLLYLGLFPEGYKFSANKIVRMWVAEDFIAMQESPERNGDAFLRELAERCLVRVLSWDRGRISTFKVHKLLHRLILEKGRTENFLDVYDPRDGGPAQILSSRRISVRSDLDGFLSGKFAHSALRSLLLFTPHNEEMTSSHCHDISTDYLSLRVFDFMQVKFKREDHDLKLTNLERLRYLSVANGVWILTITSMRGLLYFYGRCQLRTQVHLMNDLRYICVERFGMFKTKDGEETCVNDIHHLHNLQGLETVTYDDWVRCNGWYTIKELGISFPEDMRNKIETFNSLIHLKWLKKLCLYGFKGLPPLNTLSSFSTLLELVLHGNVDNEQALAHLPDSLEKLELMLTRVKEDPLRSLSHLRNLRTLKLARYAFLGGKMTFESGQLDKLEHLEFEDLHYLEECEVKEDALQALCSFKIIDCRSLKILSSKLASFVGDLQA